ncbi:cytochrome P450 [Streptomyces pathocidini]|uniref:cytochrome P450 n=1 Tax=Streptomyces pathocidini TaxID=1650571 RepID=UPI0033CFA1DE
MNRTPIPAEAATVFPTVRSDPYAPPRDYLSDGRPGIRRVSLRYGGTAWLVTDHPTARLVLADTRFSSDSTLPGYPSLPLAVKHRIPGHLLSMDPPEHTRLRRLVAAQFSAARVRESRPRFRASVRTLAEALAQSGTPDLVADFAVPLPSAGLAPMLGVPMEDRGFFETCATDLQRHDATAVTRRVAAGRMEHYLVDQLAARGRNPGNDLLTHLARGVDDGFSTEELAGLANVIIMASLETTTGLFALTMLSLLRDRRQRERAVADPATWAAPAVREALRYWTIVQHGVARVATRDTELAGCRIRREDAVIVHLPTANRDASVYTDPDTFDMTRTQGGHLAFGHGVHRCLGSSLAENLVEIAVVEILLGLPGLCLSAPPDAHQFLDDMLVYGLRSLPITWEGTSEA